MESERERVRKAMEGVVDEVLDREEHSAPTMVEIEEEALKVCQRVGERVARLLVERQEAVRPVPGPACPHCGKEMRYRGSFSVTVVSRVGPLKLRRGYYYCEYCHSGLFPLDRQLGLRDQHWSEGVVKEVVWLSALLPYEQVAETLERVGQIPISDSTAWRLTQERGEQFRQREEAERRAANALSLRRGFLGDVGRGRGNGWGWRWMEG